MGREFPFPRPLSCPNPKCLLPIPPKPHGFYTRNCFDEIIDDYAGEISRPEEKFFWRLTMKRGYIMAEALIRWAQECLKELELKKSEG
ncbi:MAG: hypothetical protein K6U74_04690 [Firmicutes bacterium]|nr:hypothetical protein [Bacillota bacterium]